MKFQNYKSGMHLANSVVFGFWKILRKEKKKIERKMNFFMFGCLMKNIKENQI